MMSSSRKLDLGKLRQVVVFNAPGVFEPELAALHGVEILRGVRSP